MCVECSGTYILQDQTPGTSLLTEPPQTPTPFILKKAIILNPGRPQAKYAAEKGLELLMFLLLLPSSGIIDMYYMLL